MTRNDFLIWLAGSDWVMASDGGYRLDDNKFLYVRSDTIDFGYCDDEGVFNLSYYFRQLSLLNSGSLITYDGFIIKARKRN